MKWKRTTICLWNCGGQAVAAEQQKDYSLLLLWDDIKKYGALYYLEMKSKVKNMKLNFTKLRRDGSCRLRTTAVTKTGNGANNQVWRVRETNKLHIDIIG